MLDRESGIYYQDQTNEAGLAIDSPPLTGWGTVLADFDLDGHLDLVATYGHIRRENSQRYPYQNPPIIWHNKGDHSRQRHCERGSYFQALTWAADWPAAISTATANLTDRPPSCTQRCPLERVAPARGASWSCIYREVNPIVIHRSPATVQIGESRLVSSIDGGGVISCPVTCGCIGLVP